MLSGQHFYYRTIRRNVIAFGTLFKNIQLVKYAANTFTEISRTNVPLAYCGKENYITRLLLNPDLHKPTQINLPRMSFEMTNIEYDSSRKLSPYLTNFSGGQGASVSYQYQGVPYNLDFQLYIYARNVEDGTQIVEQILPYFNPDYTLSMTFIEEMAVTRDIPIILEKVNYEPSYEGDAETKTRVLIWNLSFKVKTYFFGPISKGGLITQSTANTFTYYDDPTTVFTLYTNPAFRDFKKGEVIYQGSNLADATTTGTVVSWSNYGPNTASVLKVAGRRGRNWSSSSNVIGTQSAASASIVEILPSAQHIAQITVTPDPIDANPDDDFGFTETIIEWPNT